MEFLEDDRAQSVMVGAVLLFGMLIISFSVFQATVVPSENKEVEFNDYLQGSNDMTELRNALMDTASGNTQQAVTVRTGTRYPARALFVNPGPATGSLETTAPETLTLWNVESVSGDENVDAYLAAEGRTLNLSTRDVVFVPDYNQLDASPVRISHGLVYRNASRPVTLTTQPLVRGNRITLLSVTGDLGGTGLSTDVTVEPVSASTRTVGIRNATDDPITLTIPTRLSVSRWQEILAAQQDTGHVSGIGPGPRPQTVNLTLEPSTHYELRLAQVEVRTTDGVGHTAKTEPRYLVGRQDGILTEEEDGRTKLTVEVRDRFNNARSDANVTFNASAGQFEDRGGAVLGSPNATVKTGEDGQAIIWYNASQFGIQTVDVYLGDEVNESLSAEKQRQYHVRTTGRGGGGVDGGAADGGLFLFLEDVSVSAGSKNITWELNNTGSDLNLTGVQLGFVSEYRKSGGGSVGTGNGKNKSGGGGNSFADGPNEITDIYVNGVHRPVTATERLQPDFSFTTVQVTAGQNTVVTRFDQDVAVSNQNIVFVRYHLFFEGGITATYDQVVDVG